MKSQEDQATLEQQLIQAIEKNDLPLFKSSLKKGADLKRILVKVNHSVPIQKLSSGPINKDQDHETFVLEKLSFEENDGKRCKNS